MKDKIMGFLKKSGDGDYYRYESVAQAKHVHHDTGHGHEKSNSRSHENPKTKDWEQFCGNVLEKFKSRRSIRKFVAEDVDDKIIHDIICAAMNAPCAGNIQNYDVVVVKDQQARADIARIESQQFWIADAPVLLVVTQDANKLRELYPHKGQKYAIQNAAAFIENIIMLAHTYGLGTCWVESCDVDVLRNYLGIPMSRDLEGIVVIGHAAEVPEEPHKINHMTKIFFENYGNKTR